MPGKKRGKKRTKVRVDKTLKRPGIRELKKRNWLEDDPRESELEIVPGCLEYVHDPYTPGSRPLPNITEVGRQVVRRMAARGYSQQLIAACLGISLSRFRTLKREDEALAECFNVGVAGLERTVTDSLLRMMHNGNVVAGIFLGKAKLGWRDDGGNVETKSNVTIVMPGAMTPEAYQQMLQSGVTPMQLPQPAENIKAEILRDEERTLDKQPLIFDTTGEEKK